MMMLGAIGLVDGLTSRRGWAGLVGSVSSIEFIVLGRILIRDGFTCAFLGCFRRFGLRSFVLSFRCRSFRNN